jgi:hypothetical protein
MHHVAIMKPSWKLIPKILSGEKTIESRWYQSRRAPWNKVEEGDTVYFKNSGQSITAQATVSKVLQFEISHRSDLGEIVRKYGKEIALINTDPETWHTKPKYCILIFLSNPAAIKKPFDINKTGFGNAVAWLCVGNIKKIKVVQ